MATNNDNPIARYKRREEYAIEASRSVIGDARYVLRVKHHGDETATVTTEHPSFPPHHIVDVPSDVADKLAGFLVSTGYWADVGNKAEG